MRRIAIVIALLAALAIFATPVAAQDQQDRWLLSAGLGPSFGTFGSTPAFDGMGGYRINDTFALVGEVGLLRSAPAEKAALIAPALSPVVPAEVRVNGYHANLNLIAQPASWGRWMPYTTAGMGTFIGSTVASGNVGPSEVRQYQREGHFATNLGVGATYRLTDWFGLNADYRHFIVSAADTQHVNRFTTGVRLFFD